MAVNFTNSTTYPVTSSVRIAHSYHFVQNVFNKQNSTLAEMYMPWKRCLAIVDDVVYHLYGDRIKAYFNAHAITATIKPTHITEDNKNIETLLEVCDWFTAFDILRREPVLVIGGGLVTDVVGLFSLLLEPFMTKTCAGLLIRSIADPISTPDLLVPFTAEQRSTYACQRLLSVLSMLQSPTVLLSISRG